MPGIIALFGEANESLAGQALERLAHRGPGGQDIFRIGGGVLGFSRLSSAPPDLFTPENALVMDGTIFDTRALGQPGASGVRNWLAKHGTDGLKELTSGFALVFTDGQNYFAARDPIGEKALYMMQDGKRTWFASEIKALYGLGSAEIVPVMPGAAFDSVAGWSQPLAIADAGERLRDLQEAKKRIAEVLEKATARRLEGEREAGAFLSGGLDSSITAAVAARLHRNLMTFSVGLKGAPDLEKARSVARQLNTKHFEYVISPEDVLGQLPEIIYHLESFDRDLIRSSVACYFASRLAAQHVPMVLTGEGSDELFGGYSHERSYKSPAKLHKEIIRLLKGLHWIGLQRGDRMTAAHSLDVRLPFLDMDMVRLGLAIDPELKLVTEEKMEKWLVRAAFEGVLAPDVIWRKKAQFDEGSGVAGLMPQLAKGKVRPAELEEFAREAGDLAPRDEEEGWYYRIFRQHYDLARVRKTIGRWETPPE